MAKTGQPYFFLRTRFALRIFLPLAAFGGGAPAGPGSLRAAPGREEGFLPAGALAGRRTVSPVAAPRPRKDGRRMPGAMAS